eukprot:Gb_41710 [translate_table: standard]
MKNCSANAGAHSGWQWPVTYLVLGEVAAMVTLISLGSIILIYTFWKLSRQVQPGSNGASAHVLGDSVELCPVDKLEDKIIVIMPGDEKPTFLAKPVPATGDI